MTRPYHPKSTTEIHMTKSRFPPTDRRIQVRFVHGFSTSEAHLGAVAGSQGMRTWYAGKAVHETQLLTAHFEKYSQSTRQKWVKNSGTGNLLTLSYEKGPSYCWSRGILDCLMVNQHLKIKPTLKMIYKTGCYSKKSNMLSVNGYPTRDCLQMGAPQILMV